MEGGEPIPYLEGIPGVSVFRLVGNHIQVGRGNRWKDAIESVFETGSCAEGTGKGLCGALGVRLDGEAHFGGGGLKLSLPQQKIAVLPGDLSRKEIGLLSLQEGGACGREIALRFIDGGKGQPSIRRSWI